MTDPVARRREPKRERPPCGPLDIYTGKGGAIVTYCPCGRLYAWRTSLTSEQLAIWVADHDSYFGLGRPWVGKAADIPDEAFVKAIKETIRRRNLQPPIPSHGWSTASRWDVATVLAGHPELVGTSEATQDWPGVPWKVVLAKAKRLVRRDLIDGCTCGCRGDFQVIA